MPLVFAAAMGGNLSLIGAPGNMIAQSALEPLGLKFGFFEYAIVGLPILIVGILFYATIGFKILPHHDTTDAMILFLMSHRILASSKVEKSIIAGDSDCHPDRDDF